MPATGRISYGSKEAEPYRERVDKIVRLMLGSNREARKANESFYDSLEEKRKLIESICASQKIDESKIKIIEQIEADYKRRQGNIIILLLPIITKMRIDDISGFGNNMFLIFMVIGGAMMIPAGQHLFARLFGSADDLHAGGGFLRSAFYGGRIASALAFGTALKLIRGTSHLAHHKKGKTNNKKPMNGDGSEKYSEEKSETKNE